MKKLLLAGVVLAMGIALAWPFRKTDSEAEVSGRDKLVTSAPTAQPHEPTRSKPLAQKHVVAKMTGLSHAGEPASDSPVTSPVTSPFDLAGHPAFRGSPMVEPPHVPSTYQPDLAVEDEGPPRDATGRTVYGAVKHGENATPMQQRTGLLHTVSNGDTLERLAKRYLRDPGRGLEIFDLNRDRLTNPHLLPIGVELRIPPHLSRDVD